MLARNPRATANDCLKTTLDRLVLEQLADLLKHYSILAALYTAELLLVVVVEEVVACKLYTEGHHTQRTLLTQWFFSDL